MSDLQVLNLILGILIILVFHGKVEKPILLPTLMLAWVVVLVMRS